MTAQCQRCGRRGLICKTCQVCYACCLDDVVAAGNRAKDRTALERETAKELDEKFDKGDGE